jgi:hypothetical protein
LAAAPLDPLMVSTETPLVGEVVKVFNAARQQRGLPALKISRDLQEIAKLQVKDEVEAQPTAMTKGAPKKKAKREPVSVTERAEKLGYRYRDLKEITVPAGGPVVTVLAEFLRDPKSEYHKDAFGPCTDFGVAEGRDPRGLPFLSVIFGTPEPQQGDDKGVSGVSKDSTGAKAASAPTSSTPKRTP